MRRSIALSILAALSASAYAQPNSDSGRTGSRTDVRANQPIEPMDQEEKQRIMKEIRIQVGGELNRD